jgi:GH43 family beta-xylosidase
LNLFLVSNIQTKLTQSANVSTFYNVIVQDGADPWMYRHTDGWYYLTRTTGGNVQIWRSLSLTSIDGGETISVWAPSGSGPACSAIWAPELHFINSIW